MHTPTSGGAIRMIYALWIQGVRHIQLPHVRLPVPGCSFLGMVKRKISTVEWRIARNDEAKHISTSLLSFPPWIHKHKNYNIHLMARRAHPQWINTRTKKAERSATTVSRNRSPVRLPTGTLLTVPRTVSLESNRFGPVRFFARSSRKRETD